MDRIYYVSTGLSKTMFKTYQMSSAETFVSAQIPVNGEISLENQDHLVIINGLQILDDDITNHKYCFHIIITMKDFEDDRSKIEISKPIFAKITNEDLEAFKFKNFNVVNFEEVEKVILDLTFYPKSKKMEGTVKIRKELDLHFDPFKTYLHLGHFERFEGFVEMRLRPGNVPLKNTFINLNDSS